MSMYDLPVMKQIAEDPKLCIHEKRRIRAGVLQLKQSYLDQGYEVDIKISNWQTKDIKMSRDISTDNNAHIRISYELAIEFEVYILNLTEEQIALLKMFNDNATNCIKFVYIIKFDDVYQPVIIKEIIDNSK